MQRRRNTPTPTYWETDMKKIILAAVVLALSAGRAHAITQTFVALASATACNIQVSTQTPTRIDNFNGNCEGLMPGRNVFRYTNLAGNPTLYAGFSASVSSIPGNGRLGEPILAGEKVSLNISEMVSYYVISATATSGPYIPVSQAKPIRLPGE